MDENKLKINNQILLKERDRYRLQVKIIIWIISAIISGLISYYCFHFSNAMELIIMWFCITISCYILMDLVYDIIEAGFNIEEKTIYKRIERKSNG